MADVSHNSDVVANIVATPRVHNVPSAKGVVLEQCALVTYTAADSAPSLASIFEISAFARVTDLLLSSLDFTTAGAIDIGVHALSAAGVVGAAVDADFFATAVDLSGGPYNNLSVVNESTTNTPVKQNQPLWQALGVSAAPAAGTRYMITATIATTFNTTPLDVLFKIRYVA